MPEYLSISKFYFIFVPSVAFISIGKFGEFRRKTPQFDLTNCRVKTTTGIYVLSPLVISLVSKELVSG